MSTKAQLQQEIEGLKVRLTAAQARDFNSCSIGDLSSALLDRLDTMKQEKRDEIDASEEEFDKIDNAWSEADGADDRVRELDGYDN